MLTTSDCFHELVINRLLEKFNFLLTFQNELVAFHAKSSTNENLCCLYKAIV